MRASSRAIKGGGSNVTLEMNARRLISSLTSYLAYFTGLLFILKLINRRLSRIPIITYHSISDDSRNGEYRSCLDLLGMVVTRKTFSKHIKYISENYDVIGLDDFVDSIRNNKKPPHNAIVISFDDGFKDNYVNAYPLFKKYGFKATFFVIGNSLVENGAICTHALYTILDQLSGQTFCASLENFFSLNIDNLTNKSKTEIAKALRTKLDRLSFQEKIDMLRRICEQNRIDFRQIISAGAYMSRDELSTLCKEGHLLGAHSMTHDKLTQLPLSLAKSEIMHSKHIVENISGSDFIPFSYPHGTRDSFNGEIKRCLRENQLGCAVTTIEGLNRMNSDLYKLKRIEIGNFNKIEFVAHLSGFIGDMKMILKKALNWK